jgi:hypothetical protein|uniref:Uncharacterized protein n=1 Tax=Siphoviridae sp. ctoic9 TaxID=2825671 RepID=A0A8S5Q8C0_9CAUD|nr:MAG TPA: hypothetical protein [Siphoviridae sp. ctoic9]
MYPKKEEHYTWEVLEDIRDSLTSIEERLVAMEEYIERSVGSIEEMLNDTVGYDRIVDVEYSITDHIDKCFDNLQSSISDSDDLTRDLIDKYVAMIQNLIIDSEYRTRDLIHEYAASLQSSISDSNTHLEKHRLIKNMHSLIPSEQSEEDNNGY